MVNTSRTIWIESSGFAIEPGEDAATNPGVYGKGLSRWIAEQLRRDGYDTRDPFPEDWGWCVPLASEAFPVWIGCANEWESDSVWGAYVVAEPGLLRRIFTKTDTAGPLERVGGALHEVMNRAPELKRLWFEEMQ